MSGILAVWKAGDEPVLKSELRSMVEPMNRRGPDGNAIWNSGPVGMGHALLATTPEAATEELPLEFADSGLTITADARLDNRMSLADQLGLADQISRIGDGELILRSYQKWGDDCAKFLLGDFAFCIWDQRHQKMFCARDHLGMKQILYTQIDGKLFACAGDAESLLRLDAVPRRINQARILDCLTDHLESVDKTSTMFSNIFRLPPGHTIRVSAGTLNIQSYWEMQPPEELQLADDGEYQEAFKEVFDEAVRARLRGGGVVGSMLSGGLDSNSVVASAGEIRKTQSHGDLQTISAIGEMESESVAETRAIIAASKQSGIRPHFVSLSDMNSLAPKILQDLPQMAEPFDGSMNMIRAVYDKANRAGLKVVLDGVGGDAAMDIGNYGKRLIKKGKLIRAWREMKADDQFWGGSTSGTEDYLRALLSVFLPTSVRHWRGRMASKRQMKELIQQANINKDFAEQFNLYGRLEKFRTYGSFSTWQNAQHHAVRVCTHPNEVVARERYDRVAAEYGIETRDPFRDLRVVSFCASLPSSQKSKNGLPKYILRQAFASSFPDEIKRRMGKEDLGWSFTKIVLDQAMAMSKYRANELKAILTPYQSNLEEIDLFCEDRFYLANWIADQHSKSLA